MNPVVPKEIGWVVDDARKRLTILVGVVWEIHVVAKVGVIRVDVDYADIQICQSRDFEMPKSASLRDLDVDIGNETCIASSESGL